MARRGNVWRIGAGLALLAVLALACWRVEWVTPSVAAEGTEAAPAKVAKVAEEPYDLSSIVVLTRVLSYVKNYYYDPSLVDAAKMFKSALEDVARSIPSVMIAVDEPTKSYLVSVGGQQLKASYADIDSVWKIQYAMSDLFRFIQPHLDRNVNPKDVEYAAINGMLNTLDPHSILMPPKFYREMQLQTRGNFGGLGIQIGLRDGKLTVLAPIPDTPAWRAGIKPKDVIVKIDGASTINMALDEAVTLMRGAKGEPCTITVERKGLADPKDFTIIRDIINVQSVNAKLLPNAIGYVRVSSFQGNTTADLKDALAQLKRQGALKGLILDLRGNPGGLLDAAIQVSDLFLPSGEIVTTVGAGNKRLDVSEAVLLGTEDLYPMVVLLESTSASASEIVAGALKNNNRAVIVGDRSFGKGSVQMLYGMDDDSALKLTIAQYLTPGDVSIQSVGIVPDVQLLPVLFEKDFIDFFSSDRMRREQDLKRHLTSKVTTDDKPFESLRYLFDEKRDTLGPDASPGEVNTNDFSVQFAAKLLQKVGPTVHQRPIILQRGVDLIHKTAQAEEAKIGAALLKQGVDWTLAKAAGATSAEAHLVVGMPQPLAAGSEVPLALTVKNTGTVPLVRLRALSESDNPAFDNVEFFFGLVKPGQSKTWTQKVKIPKESDARSDDVTFRFADMTDTPPAAITERLSVEPKPKSSFGYTYRLIEVEGNGDGLIQKGEKIKLDIIAENRGPGLVDKGLITIKNSESQKGINIEAGRFEFGKLAVGERAEAELTFKVENDLDEPSFKLDLLVLDLEMRSLLSDTLRFEIAPTLAWQTNAAPTLVTLPLGTTIYGAPDQRQPALARLAANTDLPLLARAGKWFRLDLGDKRQGYAFSESGFKPAAGTSAKPVALSVSRLTPRIELDNESGILYTEGARIALSGRAYGEFPILDLYILDNGKKVYYKSSREQNGSGALVFGADFPIEEGSNVIVIVARLSEDFVGRRVVHVYRKKSPGSTGSSGKSRGDWEGEE